MSYQLYSSDVTDREWDLIRSMLPRAKPCGRPRSTDMRLVLNAIFYVGRGGIAWRYLPREYPPWQTVYGYFRRRRLDGVWQRIHDRLRSLVRRSEGRSSQPTVAILDSQSVKTTERGGEQRGYDAGRRLAGGKRHLLVDVLGLVLVAVVHAACTQEYDGAKAVLEKVRRRYGTLCQIWADSICGHKGLPEWAWALRDRGELDLEVVSRPAGQKGFQVLPRRWVIERTFAWLGFHRRLSKVYEALPATSEAMIYVAMICLVLARLR